MEPLDSTQHQKKSVPRENCEQNNTKKNLLVFVAMLFFFKFHSFFENLFKTNAEGNIWARFVDGGEREREEVECMRLLVGGVHQHISSSPPKMCGFTFYSFFSHHAFHQYNRTGDDERERKKRATYEGYGSRVEAFSHFFEHNAGCGVRLRGNSHAVHSGAKEKDIFFVVK